MRINCHVRVFNCNVPPTAKVGPRCEIPSKSFKCLPKRQAFMIHLRQSAPFIILFFVSVNLHVMTLQKDKDGYLSLVMRKPAFCICENKDADQLRGNREADQRLCFRYTDSTIPLLPKSEILSF